MSVDEPIAVVDYDPAWPRFFERERQRLRNAFGDAAVDVQHFGSTAVPGMAVEPIVDILVGLRALEPREKHVAVLTRLGYEYLGEARVPGRLAFRKRRPAAFNVAAVEWGGRLWRDNLLLHDFLRANPEEVHLYERHKYELVAWGASTLLRYSEQNEELVAELLRRAGAWVAALADRRVLGAGRALAEQVRDVGEVEVHVADVEEGL